MYLTELFVIAGAVVFIYLYRNYKGDNLGKYIGFYSKIYFIVFCQAFFRKFLDF